MIAGAPGGFAVSRSALVIVAAFCFALSCGLNFGSATRVPI
jgi:hypothetical protein